MGLGHGRCTTSSDNDNGINYGILLKDGSDEGHVQVGLVNCEESTIPVCVGAWRFYVEFGGCNGQWTHIILAIPDLYSDRYTYKVLDWGAGLDVSIRRTSNNAYITGHTVLMGDAKIACWYGENTFAIWQAEVLDDGDSLAGTTDQADFDVSKYRVNGGVLQSPNWTSGDPCIFDTDPAGGKAQSCLTNSGPGSFFVWSG